MCEKNNDNENKWPKTQIKYPNSVSESQQQQENKVTSIHKFAYLVRLNRSIIEK